MSSSVSAFIIFREKMMIIIVVPFHLIYSLPWKHSPALSSSVEWIEIRGGPLLSVACVRVDEQRVGERILRVRGNNQQQRNKVASDKTASTEQPMRMPQARVGRPQTRFDGLASMAGGNNCATIVTDCWWMTPCGRFSRASWGSVWQKRGDKCWRRDF